MGQEFLEHSREFTWVDEQLRERAKLGQGLDISFQVCRVNEAGLGGEDEGFQFLVKWLPI